MWWHYPLVCGIIVCCQQRTQVLNGLLMLVNGHPAEQLVDEKGKESLLVMERKEVKHHEQTVHKRWVPPLTGTLKINVDVAFKPEIEDVLWLLSEIMKAILN